MPIRAWRSIAWVPCSSCSRSLLNEIRCPKSSGFVLRRDARSRGRGGRARKAGEAPCRRPHRSPLRAQRGVGRGAGGGRGRVGPGRVRGVLIFDISDVHMPRQVAAVQTCRGSHTHTLVTDPDDEGNVYLYASGTSSVRSAGEPRDSSGLKPEGAPTPPPSASLS